MADILVESFDANIANGSTYTLTNDVGSVSSAFIHRPGPSDKCSGGPIGNTGNINPVDAHAGMALTDTDTITFYAGSSTSRKVMGEVWRYVGASGGANEFIKRGSHAISLSGSTASASVSGIVDRNKCVPFITGITTTSGSVSDYETATAYAYINSSGSVVVGRNNSGTTAIVYVDVVEFTGANWAVGYGKSSNHDSVDETVTLNTDSTGSGGSTFDVGDWSTAFLEVNMGGDSSETGLSDVLTTVYPAAATTQAVFCFESDGDGTAANDSDGYIFAIQNDDLIVNYGAITNISEGNNSYNTVGFPSGTNTSRSIDELALTFWADTTGTGTAHARARLNARITAASGTVQHWVHRSGNDIDVRYSVIDLSQLDAPTGDSLTADSITSSTSIDNTAIAQSHNIGITDISIAANIDNSTISQIHNIAAIEITSGCIINDNIIAQTHNIVSADISSLLVIDLPMLSSSGSDNLNADSIDLTSSIDLTTILQTNKLLYDSINILSSVDNATIEQTHNIQVNDLTLLSLVDVAIIKQTHNIGVDDIVILSGITNPIIFEGEAPREILTLSVCLTKENNNNVAIIKTINNSVVFDKWLSASALIDRGYSTTASIERIKTIQTNFTEGG